MLYPDNYIDELYWSSIDLQGLSAKYVRITVNLSPEDWSYWAFVGEIEIYAKD